MPFIEGVPQPQSTPPSPYKGLTYDNGFEFTKTLTGRGANVRTATSALRGPSDIGIDATSGVESYQLEYFDFLAGLSTNVRSAPLSPLRALGPLRTPLLKRRQNPAVVAGINVTLSLYGKTDAGGSVTATCNFVVPLVIIGTPTSPIPTQRCTLPATFARVTDVVISVAGALAPAQFFSIPYIKYTLHKYC